MGEVGEEGEGRMHNFNSYESLKAKLSLYAPNHIKQDDLCVSELIISNKADEFSGLE